MNFYAEVVSGGETTSFLLASYNNGNNCKLVHPKYHKKWKLVFHFIG